MTDVHPLFIFSFLEMNYWASACKLIKAYMDTCENPTTASEHYFFVEYDSLAAWIKEEGQPGQDPLRVMEKYEEELDAFKDQAQERKLKGLSAAESMLLVELVSILQDVYRNRRTQDPFIPLFLLQVKLFNLGQKGLAGLPRQKYLRSKEVIWALHCQQPETLLDLCFVGDPAAAQQQFTWDNFKKYSIPLWYEDAQKLKGFVEKIALLHYKQTK